MWPYFYTSAFSEKLGPLITQSIACGNCSLWQLHYGLCIRKCFQFWFCAWLSHITYLLSDYQMIPLQLVVNNIYQTGQLINDAFLPTKIVPLPYLDDHWRSILRPFSLPRSIHWDLLSTLFDNNWIFSIAQTLHMKQTSNQMSLGFIVVCTAIINYEIFLILHLHSVSVE